MANAKVWKLGKGYAGITSRGTRIWKKTKAEARKRVGLTKKTTSTKKSKSKKITRKSSNKKGGGGRKLAKRGFNTAKIFSLLRMISLGAPAIKNVLDSSQNPHQKMVNTIKVYTGFNMQDGSWNFANLIKGWMPYLGTSVVTYGIPKLTGLIRKIL